MVFVRLAGIGGEELASRVDLVADRRHVMLVATGSEKGDDLPGGDVPIEQSSHVSNQLDLGAIWRRKVERPA